MPNLSKGPEAPPKAGAASKGAAAAPASAQGPKPEPAALPLSAEDTAESSGALPVIPEIPDPYVGTVLCERYRIQHKIGAGGMGAVYLAEHIVIERKVAIKILSQDFATKADLVQRFIQEARAAARIGHENIVEVYDFGETASGSVFFAMEYLEGHDLATLIQQKGALQASQAKPIVSQICKALASAHSKGIVHRDLKPENIYLINKDGRSDFVKILDFGIAKINNVDDNGGRLTRAGMIFGTPEYMSPEQARGEVPDHRVDIYALGCIIYEMLTGKVPFQAESFMGTLTKHMFEVPDPPSRRARFPVPPELEAICLKAMEKDRNQRIQTMQEFGQAIDGEIRVAPPLMPPAATSGIVPGPAGISDPSLQMRRGQVPMPPPSVPSMPPQMYPPGMGMPSGYGIPAPMPMGMSGPVVMGQPVPNSGMFMQPAMVAMQAGRAGPAMPGYTTAPPTSYEVSRQPQASGGRRLAFILVGASLGVAVLAALLFWPASQGPALPDRNLPTGTGRAGKTASLAVGPALVLVRGLPDSRVMLDFKDVGAIKSNGDVMVEAPTPGTREWSAHIKVTKDGYGEFSTRILLRSGESFTVLADQPKKKR